MKSAAKIIDTIITFTQLINDEFLQMRLKSGTYKIFCLLLLCIFCSPVKSQTRTYCDSLIKSGLRARAQNDHVKSIEKLTKARILAEKKHWEKQTYDAIFGLGINYYDMLDYGESLNYFLESYMIAVKELRPEDEIASLNNIANLYTKQQKYEKAKEYYKKAFETATDKNIDSRKGLPLMNIGYIYNLVQKPLKARPYIIQSMPYLKGESLVAAKILLIENDLLLGNSAVAREKAWALYHDFPNPSKEDVDVYLYVIISKSYLSEQNFLQAEKFALKVLERKPPLDKKKEVFELLADIYRRATSFDKALQYKDSIIIVDRKLDDIKNGSLFENNKVKFEIQNYKNQISVKEEKLTAERKIFFSAILVILALIIITALVLRQKKIIADRNHHLVELNFEKEKSNNLLLEKQVSDALLEQERLKNEVETRNRKLSAKALYLSDRNELIEEVVSYLSKKPKLSKDQTLANHLQSLKSHLRADNEWNSFIIHFEEVNRGFLNRLKELHPSLNSNDIKFIAYIYMNLSIKEIASILNITVMACKKRKERLSAKMGISREEELFDYISVL